MRNHGCQIKFKFNCVGRVRVSARRASILPPRIDVGVGVAGPTLRAARSRALRIYEFAHARAQIIHRHLIKWKHACQRAPLGGHVGDGHTRIHGKIRHSIAHKFNGVIEHFVFVEEPAQGDDDVLARDASGKISLEHHFGDFGNLPPSDSGGPDTRGVGSHDRCAQRRDRAVQIRMRIARYHQRTGNNIALLHHHLMRDAGARRVKVDPVLTSEHFNLRVLLQIFRCDILNVVIDGEHRLCGICDRRSADLFELWNYRAGIVVRHHMTRTNRDEIASPHHGSHGESISVSRGNLFDQR